MSAIVMFYAIFDRIYEIVSLSKFDKLLTVRVAESLTPYLETIRGTDCFALAFGSELVDLSTFFKLI